MKQVGANEAKTHLSRVLDEVPAKRRSGHQVFVLLRRNVQVLVDPPVPKLDLKNFSLLIIAGRLQHARRHRLSFHGAIPPMNRILKPHDALKPDNAGRPWFGYAARWPGQGDDRPERPCVRTHRQAGVTSTVTADSP